MATTVKDFVKMLYERECGVVVMLCGCEEGGVELCAQYWPATAATMMKYGEFMVSTASIDDSSNGFIQRDITIIDPKVRLLSTPRLRISVSLTNKSEANPLTSNWSACSHQFSLRNCN